jgi:hypothetical protein
MIIMNYIDALHVRRAANCIPLIFIPRLVLLTYRVFCRVLYLPERGALPKQCTLVLP